MKIDQRVQFKRTLVYTTHQYCRRKGGGGQLGEFSLLEMCREVEIRQSRRQAMASGCRLETKFTRVAGTAPMSTWKHIIDSHHGNKMGSWQTLTQHQTSLSPKPTPAWIIEVLDDLRSGNETVGSDTDQCSSLSYTHLHNVRCFSTHLSLDPTWFHHPATVDNLETFQLVHTNSLQFNTNQSWYYP